MVTLLSEIVDSKTQGSLLAFLLVAPVRSFSTKELAVRIKTSIPSAQTAARALERQNLLKSFSKGGTRFYLLNLKHVQIPLMQKEMLRTLKPWQDELQIALNKIGSLSSIVLSGVFVGRPELAVDLLLVGKVQPVKLEKFLTTANKQFGGELNYSIMSAEEFKIRRDTFDRFLKDIFDYPHLVLFDKTASKAKAKKKGK